mmetsp:Transcript_15598/g.21318  ORF Transcript_15598/g.21318 Transcript_15598/m.21318 type:complete len:375 (-) Transcript_15598:215-1339(-)
MHGGGGCFSRGKEPWHHLVRDEVSVFVEVGAHYLSVVVRGNASHVVVNCGQNRNRLLGDVHARKDGRGLRDAGQALRQQVRGEVVEVQVNVVLLGPDAAPLAYLHGHGARHDVPGGQVLGRGRVPLHEALPFAVAEDAALAAAALGDEAARAVDAGGVELHELGVLVGEAGPQRHGVAVAGAGVRGGAAEVGSAVAAGGEHGVLGADAVDGAVFHVQRNHAVAVAGVVHEQVHGEVLDEVGGVEGERAPVERVEHGVAGAVSRAGAPVGLAALAVLQALPAEGALVDLAVFRAAERKPELLQLQHSRGRFSAHVMDGVLVAQPVRSLHRVVHVPPPVVLRHVAQRRVDAALRCHGVRSRGEQLRHARGLEPRFR